MGVIIYTAGEIETNASKKAIKCYKPYNKEPAP